MTKSLPPNRFLSDAKVQSYTTFFQVLGGHTTSASNAFVSINAVPAIPNRDRSLQTNASTPTAVYTIEILFYLFLNLHPNEAGVLPAKRN